MPVPVPGEFCEYDAILIPNENARTVSYSARDEVRVMSLLDELPCSDHGF